MSGSAGAGGAGPPSVSRRISGTGLHRVLSNLSIQSVLSNGSVVTLTELPSYEAALELMKGKDPEKKDGGADASP